MAENLRLVHAGATQRQLEAAARAAHAHEFISALPHGYDTVIGERGLKLSGGERQRLSTVRLADRVIVLDRGRPVESGDPTDLLGRHRRMLWWAISPARSTT